MKTLSAFRIRAMALALACAATIGCSNQPAPEKHHYLLRAPDASAGILHGSQVQLGKLRVPGYLRSAQIALMISTTEIRPANSHLWAEAPTEAIERFFRSRLAWTPPDAGRADSPRVDIDIIQLLGNLEGEVRLKAVYSFRQGTQALEPSRFFDATVDQVNDGYPGLVEAHNELLERLALAVADNAAQLPPPVTQP